MQQITEQQILAMAPNAAAAANGKKISQKGGFVRLQRSADDTFYMGECTGSGKSNYVTSADFADGAPVCRCTCPSRQFPCKHGLALLYEIMGQKKFETCEVPEDILKKREKKQAREAKAQAAAEGLTGTGTSGGAGDSAAQGSKDSAAQGSKDGAAQAAKKKAAARSANAARAKKLRKQLEGLALLEKLVQDLMKTGLGAFGGASLNTYRDLAKQLGDYYLPGPQRFLNGLILEMEAFQKDNAERHYDNAIDILERLWTLVKKSKAYLNGKLEQGEVSQDDNLLYEELGGIWKLSELEALGRSRQDVSLMQLSFWVTDDAAGRQYVDTGCWADLSSGEIYVTYNYRPLKALKYIKQEDTLFGTAEVSSAACYPGEGNLRIRWEDAKIRPVEQGDLQKVRELAAVSLKAEAKAAKNILKNALADTTYVRLLAFEQIGQCEEGLALRTKEGETILLGDAPGMEPSCERIGLLPEEGLVRNQVLLGAFYYDGETRRLRLQPLSIITERDVVRLLY